MQENPPDPAPHKPILLRPAAPLPPEPTPPTPPTPLPEAPTPMDIVRHAFAHNLTADRIERLAMMAEAWAERARAAAFTRAMLAFRGEGIIIPKAREARYVNEAGEEGTYLHADLSDVLAVVVPALTRHGLRHRWTTKQVGTALSVMCVVTHVDGHTEVSTLTGTVDDSRARTYNNALASASTLLQRYTLLAALGMTTQDTDDDGAAGASGRRSTDKGGDAPPATEGAPEEEGDTDPVLEAARAAARSGTAALTLYRESHPIPAATWRRHSRTLKQLATAADRAAAERLAAQLAAAEGAP